MSTDANKMQLSNIYKAILWFATLFCALALLINHVEAAPPIGGVSPTQPPSPTSPLVSLSSTKETFPLAATQTLAPYVAPAAPAATETPAAYVPPAAPAAPAAPATTQTPAAYVPPALPSQIPLANHASGSEVDTDMMVIYSDETTDAVAANLQDDEWRAEAAAQGMPYCVRGVLTDEDSNTAGIDHTQLGNSPNAPTVSYSLREMDNDSIGSAVTDGETAQGYISNEQFMADMAPIPQELLDLGAARSAAFNENAGSSTYANGMLFTFSPPGVNAFGAWFGDLETREPLLGVGIDGDARGGKLAYMRLFDINGTQIGPDMPIYPQEETNDAICGDPDTKESACGNKSTRWIGFVAAKPVAQMLVVVGDANDSDDDLTCRAPADGGNDADFIAQCQGGNEHLSFVGPTVCTAEATAFQLGQIAATTHNQGVQVSWKTVSEVNTHGFNVWRGTSTEPTERLNDTLIPSQASGHPMGLAYQWIDGDSTSEETPYYWLEELTADGRTIRYGPISPTSKTIPEQILEKLTDTIPIPPLALAGLALIGIIGLWLWWRR